MTLYLKYRPQTLDELDLTSVREQLTELVACGDIPHAFLFLGPKGTGKTSAARILAKILNCNRVNSAKARNAARSIEPCNECSSCLSIMKGIDLDVIELDAASNRGIDDIRSLRESVKLAAAGGKKGSSHFVNRDFPVVFYQLGYGRFLLHTDRFPGDDGVAVSIWEEQLALSHML